MPPYADRGYLTPLRETVTCVGQPPEVRSSRCNVAVRRSHLPKTPRYPYDPPWLAQANLY